jgi:acetyl-CoA carboxylase biotin carboxylase subunit
LSFLFFLLLSGNTTTLGFGKFVLQHDAFTSGMFDTHFVQKYFTPAVLNTQNPDEAQIAALMMAKLLSQGTNPAVAVAGEAGSNWVKNRRQL